MGGSWSGWLDDAVLYVMAAIIVLVGVVGANMWSRRRRERAIYQQTRRNAAETVAAERRSRRRS